MSDKLKRFLSELAVSPEKMSKFLDNPDAAMEQAELDPEERAALKSADQAKVSAALAGTNNPQAARPAELIYHAVPTSAANPFLIYYALPYGAPVSPTQPPAAGPVAAASNFLIYQALPPSAANAQLVYGAGPHGVPAPSTQPPAAGPVPGISNFLIYQAAPPSTASAQLIYHAVPQLGAPVQTSQPIIIYIVLLASPVAAQPNAALLVSSAGAAENKG